MLNYINASENKHNDDVYSSFNLKVKDDGKKNLLQEFMSKNITKELNSINLGKYLTTYF